MRRLTLRNRQGQLLLELIIGATIMSVVVAGALATIQAGRRAILRSGRRGDALASAQQTLEGRRNDVTNGTNAQPATGLIDDPLIPGPSTYPIGMPAVTDLTANFGATRSYTVLDNPTDAAGAPMPGFKEITVTVQWNEP
ncbi:MAG: hypothetical protein HY597_03365 [Candidatus Omnitrophica bacterium]|nr:hypothetical protein [Candidatus Omnitrophota bacterium]